MSLTFHADASPEALRRKLAPMALRIIITAALGVWGGLSMVIVLGVSLALLAFSLWAHKGRGAWQALTIDDDALRLQKVGQPEITVQRDAIDKVDLKGDVVMVIWLTAGKRQFALFAKERFAEATWQAMRDALAPWVK